MMSILEKVIISVFLIAMWSCKIATNKNSSYVIKSHKIINLSVVDSVFNSSLWIKDSIGCDGYRGKYLDLGYSIPLDEGDAKEEIIHKLGEPNEQTKETFVYTLRGKCNDNIEEGEYIVLFFKKETLSRVVLSL